MDYERGYVCGAVCGDGHLMWNVTAGNYGITLEVKDRDIAQHFRDCLQKIIGVSVKMILRNRTYKNMPYTTFVVYIYGKKETKKFTDIHGTKFGTFTWVPPKEAHTNEVFRRGFLRAFFDCEGTVRIRFRRAKGTLIKIRNIRASSANKAGLFDIKKLLFLECIPSIIYPSGKYYTLDIEGKSRLETYLKRIGFSSMTKQKKLETSLSFPTEEEKSVAMMRLSNR